MRFARASWSASSSAVAALTPRATADSDASSPASSTPSRSTCDGAAAEALGDAAARLEREPGLADAARADERQQPGAGPHQQLAYLLQLALTADQVAGGGGQRRGRRLGAGRPVGVELGVVREDHALQPAQLGARLDPQLVDQHAPALAHDLQRLGLPAASVERDHQVPAQPLAQRLFGHQRPQLPHEVGVAAFGDLGGEPLLDRLHPQLLEPPDLALRERLEPMVGERRPAPQRQRRLEVVARGPGLVLLERDAGPAEQLLEAVRVDRVVVDVQRVADGGAFERDGRPQPPA